MLFSRVPLGAPDAILGLTTAFNASAHPTKVNLGVGAYRDNNGKPLVLSSVKNAIAIVSKVQNYEYAPIEGLADFIKAAQTLMLGSQSPALNSQSVASIQSLSGTGALRAGAEFLKRYAASSKVYISNPTWGNHVSIFRDAGFEVCTYTYYDASSHGLNLESMCRDLSNADEGSIVVLHACAHNPTGVDPIISQWHRIRDVIRAKKLFPFLDCAYQGFATGNVDNDASAVRLFDDGLGHPFAIAQSFAKNFGLYGERVGLLSFVCASHEEAERVLSQLKIVVRPIYSSPPLHGARIVSKILNDPELSVQWRNDVKQLGDRIRTMRQALYTELKAQGSLLSWEHILTQIGMFCFTGLTKAEVDKLREQYGIFMTNDGRISIPGLNDKNVAYVANAFHTVTKNRGSKL